MEDKFSLDTVDKAATHKLQKEMALEANPWRALPRIIASYHYLRQPDVLEQFIANCRTTHAHQGTQLPWDLLIVDEAHNLVPSLRPLLFWIMPDVTVHWRSGEFVVRPGEEAHREGTVSLIAANGLKVTAQITGVRLDDCQHLYPRDLKAGRAAIGTPRRMPSLDVAEQEPSGGKKNKQSD
jgi:hypothetical protein